MRKFLACLLTSLLMTLPAQAVTVQLPAQGVLVPAVYFDAGPPLWPNTGSLTNLNSASVKFAIIGYVFEKDAAFQNGASKTIQSVSVAMATKTCAGCTSVVQVDVMTVSTSAGPPAQPSGSLVAPGATSQQAFSATTSGGMNTFTNFTTAPTVHYGDYVAFQFSVPSYDSGNLRPAGVNSLYSGNNNVQLSAFNGASWSFVLNEPVIRINFSDGTTGTLLGADVYDAWNTGTVDTFNSSSGFNETGIGLNFNIGVQIDALCAGVAVAGTTSTLTLELTDTLATPTVLGSVSPDPHTIRATGGGNNNFNQAMSCFSIAPVTVAAGTALRMGVKATGAGNITVINEVVGAAADFDVAWGCGQTCVYYTRKNAAWSSATTTQRPYYAVRVSAVNIGTGPTAATRHKVIETITPINDNEEFMPHRWAVQGE